VLTSAAAWSDRSRGRNRWCLRLLLSGTLYCILPCVLSLAEYHCGEA